MALGLFAGFFIGILYPTINKKLPPLPVMYKGSRYLVPRSKEIGKQITSFTLEGRTVTYLDSTTFYYDTIQVK